MSIVFENVTVSGGGITINHYTDPFMVTYNADGGAALYTALNLSEFEGSPENTTGLIDWGDGTTQVITESGEYSHTYASSGIYQIKIYGTVESITTATIPSYYFAATSIDSFGSINLKYLECDGWQELTNVPPSIPSTAIGIIFPNCDFLNDANISLWNTENIWYMGYMFQSTDFNQPLNNWNTSNVIFMDKMFEFNETFNQPLNNWDTSNVTTMESMFRGAVLFNQPLNNWNTANVTDMTFMFRNATSFNQPLNNWNTANVTGMQSMFRDATVFNQDLTEWCVTNIPSEPINFALNSALTANNKPVWGTCP